MRHLRFCTWLVFVLACGRSPSKQQAYFDADREAARSRVVSTRASGAGTMVRRCCHPNLDRSGTLGYLAFRNEACDELRRLLETETETVVMENLISVDDMKPHCYARFPPSIVAGLCRKGCPDKTRHEVITMFGDLDPSPEIVEALLHQLTLPVDKTLTGLEVAIGKRMWPITDADIDLHVALRLADTGESELQPVLDALVGADPRLRRVALRTFYHALQAPLDMPALLPALEKLAADADPDVALTAQIAAGFYRRWNSASLDTVVPSMLHLRDTQIAIRMLAVRRFSCRTNAAADALAQLSMEPDKRVASAAKHAIAFRAERCARLQSD